jgi:hypothetical protein
MDRTDRMDEPAALAWIDAALARVVRDLDRMDRAKQLAHDLRIGITRELQEPDLGAVEPLEAVLEAIVRR